MDKETLIKKVLGNDAKVIAPLLGGMMNQSFIVESNNKKYVLYISTKQANEMVNRPLEKQHIDIIHSLNITSRNIYFDAQNGIKINEYIEGSSIDKISQFDYQKVALLLKKLHSSKTLSPVDYLPFKRFEEYENEAKEYLTVFQENYLELKEYLLSYKEYLMGQKKVLSHNDAQRSNIIKSDDNKYFIIDFEFVGNNDEIYDIACFGNSQVEEGYELLMNYFDIDELDDDKIRRFYLWRIYISLQWYLVAIVKHYRGEGKTHGFDFLSVANHFLNNALTAYKRLKEKNL